MSKTAAAAKKDDDKAASGEPKEPEAQENASGDEKPAVAAVPDVVPPLSPRRLKPAEGEYNRWSVVVDHGVKPTDLLKTDFWQHHTKMLRPFDEIRAIAEDGSFCMWLLVLGTGPLDAKVASIGVVDMDPLDPDEYEVPKGYAVKYGGQISKWRAMRGNDVIKDGFNSRSEAQRWLGSHIMSLSR